MRSEDPERGFSTSDLSLWPLVKTVISRGAERGGLDDTINELEALLDRGKPFVHVILFETSRGITAAHLRRMREVLDRRHDDIEASVRFAAFVFPSAFGRGAARAMFRYKKPPHPYAVFSNLEEACAEAQTWVDRFA